MGWAELPPATFFKPTLEQLSLPSHILLRRSNNFVIGVSFEHLKEEPPVGTPLLICRGGSTLNSRSLSPITNDVSRFKYKSSVHTESSPPACKKLRSPRSEIVRVRVKQAVQASRWTRSQVTCRSGYALTVQTRNDAAKKSIRKRLAVALERCGSFSLSLRSASPSLNLSITGRK